MNEELYRSWIHDGTIISVENNNLLIGYGKRKWFESAPQYSNQPAFYFPDFFLQDKTPWFHHEYTTVVSIDELLSALEKYQTLSFIPIQHWFHCDFEHFETAIHELQQEFAAKRLTKAVPYVFEKTPTQMTTERLRHCLQSTLRYGQTHPVQIYGFWDECEGILGASPEMLFNCGPQEKLLLKTVACGGTRALKTNLETFKNDSKELHEHRLIVEGIQESLAPFGKVIVEQMELLKLPTLVHLMTPIQVELFDNVSLKNIIEALHPTPALGASPRSYGRVWLEEYQKKIPRARYGAPFAYTRYHGQEIRCGVAIRNMQWNEAGIRIGIGCGVVAESCLANEWQEILLKARAIKELLSL